MKGEPGPALLKPRLERMPMHPMLADKIGERETAVGRYSQTHQRPAQADSGDRAEKRDLLDEGFGPAPSAGPTTNRRRHRSAP